LDDEEANSMEGQRLEEEKAKMQHSQDRKPFKEAKD